MKYKVKRQSVYSHFGRQKLEKDLSVRKKMGNAKIAMALLPHNPNKSVIDLRRSDLKMCDKKNILKYITESVKLSLICYETGYRLLVAELEKNWASSHRIVYPTLSLNDSVRNGMIFFLDIDIL